MYVVYVCTEVLNAAATDWYASICVQIQGLSSEIAALFKSGCRSHQTHDEGCGKGMDQWMDGGIDGWVDGWMDEWVN